jgi:hypothetical protein
MIVRSSGLLGAVVALSLLVPARALAADDDKTACLDAAAKGQHLRDTHKLLQAREQLRRCGASTCPMVVQSDCAGWLAAVEKALPTVVLSAKSGAGADLFDVKVSVDGQPLATKLDGQAIPMDPGPHIFHFEGADGTSVDQQMLVREGEQSQSAAVVLGAPPATALPATPPTSPESGGSSSSWNTVGWITGGVGVASLAVGTVFGVIAMGDKNSAHCSNNLCDPGTSSGIKSAALVSDIGWFAGGVLLASGAALVLFAPKGGQEVTTSSLRVAPAWVASGGGAVLGGSW